MQRLAEIADAKIVEVAVRLASDAGIDRIRNDRG